MTHPITPPPATEAISLRVEHAAVGPKNPRNRNRFHRRQLREDTGTIWPKNRDVLGTANVGAVSELMVAADLLMRGYNVFRSVSPTARCDLVALKDGRCLRVEVKTGNFGLRGSLQPATVRHHDFDLLAVLGPDGVVHYETALGVTVEPGRYE